MQMTTFLKRVLMLDAISCLAMGAGLLAGTGALPQLLGLPQSLLAGAGAALIPIGLFILWTATRKRVAPLFVYAIILGNLAWVIESLVVAGDATEITDLGTLFVLGQAVMVAAVTLLEGAAVARIRSTGNRRVELSA